MSSTYTCGRCGGIVAKSAGRCPHCSALLGGIRCKKCGFTGNAHNFPRDRCPKCKTSIYGGGGGGSGDSPAFTPAQTKKLIAAGAAYPVVMIGLIGGVVILCKPAYCKPLPYEQARLIGWIALAIGLVALAAVTFLVASVAAKTSEPSQKGRTSK